MTFSSKQISITLGGKTLSGLRMSVIVDAVGGRMGITSTATIYGMSLSDMNALTVIMDIPNYAKKYPISISAGDAGNLTLIFSGDVLWAAMDGQNQPNVCFRIQATANGVPNAQSTQPTSFPGKVPIAQVLQPLAGQAGLRFENAGVNAFLNKPYLPGSVGHQVRQAVNHAGLEHIIEKGVLAVWTPGQPRQSSGVVISPQTGMVSYPTFQRGFLVVRSIFRPELSYGFSFSVQSDYQPACGTWTITRITHEIECLTPHGQWFTILEGSTLSSSSQKVTPSAG